MGSLSSGGIERAGVSPPPTWGQACRHHPNQACRYHPAAPLFHEGSKQWPCCAVKKWDFDDFMAVPGCVVAEHEPVVWDN